MAVSPDLLEILRCPYCVSGPTRKEGDDPGQLELVNDTWLVCQEADCGRKYPIKEDIPVMLIDEGDKWIDTPVEELPEPGPLVETMRRAVADLTGRSPALTTNGGTSDARFIQAYCPVIEFGLVNETIHAVDERCPVADIVKLTDIYERFIEGYFGRAGG